MTDLLLPTPVLTASFAAEVIKVLMPYIDALPECEVCVPHMVNPTDPNGTVGISCTEWAPLEYGIGSFEPLNAYYNFEIEAMTKNTNAGDGELAHYGLAQAIRDLLFRNTDLRMALSAISVVDPLERTLMWTVSIQRFANNATRGEFTFLSVTTLTFQTEIAC